MTLEELQQIVIANAQAIQGLSTNLSAEREQRLLDKEDNRAEFVDLRASIDTLSTRIEALTLAIDRQFDGNGQSEV